MNVTGTEGFFLGVGLTLFASAFLRWCGHRRNARKGGLHMCASTRAVALRKGADYL